MKNAEAAISSQRRGWGGRGKKFEDWGVTDLRGRVGTSAGGGGGQYPITCHAFLI